MCTAAIGFFSIFRYSHINILCLYIFYFFKYTKMSRVEIYAHISYIRIGWYTFYVIQIYIYIKGKFLKNKKINNLEGIG